MIDFFHIDEKLLALTWRQPYASLMLHEKIETRTWPTKYRGFVLICAGKTPYSTVQVLNISGYMRREIYDTVNYFTPIGQAIAIGKLIDCRPMRPEDETKCYVKYWPNLFCHIYDEVRAIEPIIWRGKLGWSEVSKEVKANIFFK